MSHAGWRPERRTTSRSRSAHRSWARVSLRFSASNGEIASNGRRLSAAELAESHGLQLVDLTSVEIEADAAAEIPVRVLERAGAVPYRFDGGRVRVAVADPGDLQSMDELRLATRHPIELVVAPISQVRSELRRLIARAPNLNLASIPMDVDFAAEAQVAVQVVEEESVQVRLVDSIITRAVESRASDVHFVPTGDALAVRIRVDGVVHELERIPNREAPGVISRIKVLAKLDIAEHRKPQDGRLSLRPEGRREIDIRVAALPT